MQCSKNVQVLEAEKKSAWTDLDRVDFEKISSKSQCSNQKIGVFKVARRSALGTRRSSFGARRSALGVRRSGSALGVRRSAKLKRASSAASVFNVFLHDWSPGGRLSVLL